MAFASEAIADWARGLSWDALPEAVRREAVRALVNWAGCTLGGSRTGAMETAVRGTALQGTTGEVPLLGRSERFDPANAALLNCLASCSQTFDDTHLPTITHPTGPVAAVLHALSCGREVSGRRFLLALALGIEIQCRISNAIVGPGKTGSGGWFITGVTGGIGAAVAGGLLLDLPAGQLVSAIGLAAAQACGTRAVHGSMAITFVPGVAARNALTTVLLSSAGFTAGPGSLDGRNGLLEVLAPGSTGDDILAGLGEAYEVLNVAYKPYPCGIVIHPAIDACLAVTRTRPVSPDAVTRVSLRVHPDAMRLCWRKQPRDLLEAQVSLFHWAAVALLRGKAGIAEGEDAAVHDPAVRAFQDRIDVTVDDSFAPDEASTEIRFNDGTVLSEHIRHASGSAANPMTDAQLSEKFLMLAEPVIGATTASQQLDLLWGCGEAADIAAILEHR